MIPTVLVLGFAAGLIAGRLAWLFVPLAALAWAVGLADANVCVADCAPDAAFLAAANAIVGVAAGALARWSVAHLFRLS